MFKPKEKPTLERQQPSLWEHELVIKISFTTLIILALILFLVVCFLLVPQTHGFYWF